MIKKLKLSKNHYPCTCGGENEQYVNELNEIIEVVNRTKTDLDNTRIFLNKFMEITDERFKKQDIKNGINKLEGKPDNDVDINVSYNNDTYAMEVNDIKYKKPDKDLRAELEKILEDFEKEIISKIDAHCGFSKSIIVSFIKILWQTLYKESKFILIISDKLLKQINTKRTLK